MQDHPLPHKKDARRWQALACYVPLLAVAAEIPWSVLLFLALIFTVGDTPYTNTQAKQTVFNVVASLPVIAGFLMGVITLAMRWPGRKLEWGCLIAGIFACALLLFWFTIGL